MRISASSCCYHWLLLLLPFLADCQHKHKHHADFVPLPWHPSSVRIAALGDHGIDSLQATKVAELIQSWDTPDAPLSAIIALGDVNYPRGSPWTIDANVGRLWHKYMHPYKGRFGSSAKPYNRYWPCPGNHDYANKQSHHHASSDPLAAYLDYFSGAIKHRRFYDVRLGPVHLFSLDSMHIKMTLNSTSPHLDASGHVATWEHMPQAVWLRRRLATSTAPWKVVYFHHAPYSSGSHGSSHHMRWPFQEWGAVAVLSGHDHSYERVLRGPDNFPYFINGMGGARTYGFQVQPEDGSTWRFTSHAGGAQLIEADEHSITFRFFSTLSTQPLDCYTVQRSPVVPDSPPPGARHQEAPIHGDSVNTAAGFTHDGLDAISNTTTNATAWNATTDIDKAASNVSSMHGDPEQHDAWLQVRRDRALSSGIGAHHSRHGQGSVHGSRHAWAYHFRDCRSVNYSVILGDSEVGHLGLPLDGVHKLEDVLGA